jgi:hypothetical protein
MVSVSRVRIFERMSELPQADWDALAEADDHATPFTRWAFLEALEESGCATPRTGWRPRHLTLWRDARLVAAAPAYERDSSDGDFSRDWGFAESAARAGLDYYPKLCLGVPFTPASGTRLLVAPGEDRASALRTLVASALELARDEGLRSVNVLFATLREAAELEACGLARRMDFQFHWKNRDYQTLDDWLAHLRAKKRHMVRRERAAPAGQGIAIRTVRGDEVRERAAEWATTVHRFYRTHIEKLMWGRPYLSARFFSRLFERMPESLEIVEATRAGRFIAGAFNLSSRTHLYGRYWGAFEEHPFLHFNVCLYHSIEDCIQRGIRVFEGGAGGEHKHARGFDPVATWSAHTFLDARLDRGIRDYLARELSARQAALARWQEEHS